MESEIDILRKPAQEELCKNMLGGRRKMPHKIQGKLDELTQSDFRAIFLPTWVSSAACLPAWILTQLLEV